MKTALFISVFAFLVALSGPAEAAGSDSFVSVSALKVHLDKKTIREYKAGRSAFSQQDLATAASHFRLAVLQSPGFALAYNDLGVCYGQQEKLNDALEAFRTAVTLDPSLSEAHSNIAVILLKFKHFAEAEREARSAVKLLPLNGKIHFILGLSIIYQNGYTSEAILHLKKAAPTVALAKTWLDKITSATEKKP